jgi:hypothetical protein
MHVVHKSMNIKEYYNIFAIFAIFTFSQPHGLYSHILFVHIISTILSAKITCFIHTTCHINYLCYIIVVIIMHIHQSHTFYHNRIMCSTLLFICIWYPISNVAPILKELYSYVTHPQIVLLCNSI